MANIAKSALIDSSAKIAADVTIGPYSIIGANVEIDVGTEIDSHVVIAGPTKIGRNNKIFPYAAIGGDPQDKKYSGEDTWLEIGDGNIIREFCTISRGTVNGGGVTRIGNNNFLMAYVHVAHDCQVGSEIVFANNACMAGHVTVGDHALFGGFALIAQFCAIGAYSFVAGGTGISKDVLPYVLVSSYHQNDATPYGLNSIGLRRNGFSNETIKNLKAAYHIIYKEDLTIKQALPRLKKLLDICPEAQLFIDALEKSQRGIVR